MTFRGFSAQRSAMKPWIRIRTPRLAIAFASDDALISQRMTPWYTRTPSTVMHATAIRNDGQKPQPRLVAALEVDVGADSVAIAACEKLRTPEPP